MVPIFLRTSSDGISVVYSPACTRRTRVGLLRADARQHAWVYYVLTPRQHAWVYYVLTRQRSRRGLKNGLRILSISLFLRYLFINLLVSWYHSTALVEKNVLVSRKVPHLKKISKNSGKRCPELGRSVESRMRARVSRRGSRLCVFSPNSLLFSSNV